MRLFRKLILTVGVLLSIAVQAQTFQIQSRDPDAGNVWLNLDASTEISFNVSASGLTGQVIPVLVPTGAAAGSVTTTWLGTAPTANLSNLVFNVHLYDNAALCNSTVSFELYFYGTDFEGSVQAGTSNSQLLRLDARGDETTLTRELSSTPGALPWPLTSVGTRSHFLRYDSSARSEVLNPANRIYYWADYNLSGAPWGQQFLVFLHALDNNGCALNPTSDFDFGDLVSTDILDVTSGTPVPVNQAPPGGAGTAATLGLGINIYDITDANPSDSDCADSVRESLNYTSGPAVLLWDYAGFGAVVRRFAIYLGQPGCMVTQANFGTSPGGNFDIDEVFISSEGEVAARLNVPTSWGSGDLLNNQFRVRWFLRKDNLMIALGGERRELDLAEVATTQIDDPENFYLEARIRRTDTDAQVSISNRGVHNRAYTLDEVGFNRSEQGGADEFFDPGEVMTFSWRIEDVHGTALPQLSYDSGIVVDSNDNGALDLGSDTYLFGNQTNPGGLNLRIMPVNETGSGSARQLLVPFELLLAGEETTLWFFVDVSGDNNGVTTTYRRYFSLQDLLGGGQDLNAEDTRMAYDHDFESGSQTNRGWSFNNDVSSPSSGGWDYTGGGPWHGEGPLAQQNASDLYRLNSPVWPLGRNSAFSFTHQTDFTPDASGGLLEYRVREAGGGWPAVWSNVIADHCASCGYYDGTYPGDQDSYLDGRSVWMAADLGPELLSVDIPDSVGAAFPDDGGEIQFRFIFADPSVASGSPSTTGWDVFNFSYGTNRLTSDNPFGVVVNSFPLTGCQGLALSFEEWAPVPLTEISFSWYETLEDLWAGNGTAPITGALGRVVPFNQGGSGVYTYYVRLSSGGMERVLSVSVDENSGISEGQAILQIVGSAAVNWPQNETILSYVGIANLVCTE